MNYVSLRRYVVGLFALVLLLVAWSVSAGRVDDSRLPAGETVQGNFYASSYQVEAAGKVEGDVYAVGGTVVVSGEVEGDVLVLGGKVRITGPVVGSLRVLGGEVELASSVGRNVSMAGGKLLLAPGSYVVGNVAVAAGELELRGIVEGVVEAAAGGAVISGEVQGPVELWLDRQGTVTILDTAVLGSTFRYRAARVAKVAAGATLAQVPEQLQLPMYHSPRTQVGWWLGELAWFFGLAVLAMVLIYLLPRKVQEVAEEALAKPWPSLGWGAAWLVLAPIGVIVLGITIIGLPLALVLTALYIIGLFVAQVAVGAAVGWYVRSLPTFQAIQSWKLFPVVLMGLLLYRLVTAVPYIGSLVALVALLWGWGALLRVQRRTLATFS